MHIRFTVSAVGAGGEQTDVLVTALPGTTLAAIAGALRAAAGGDAGQFHVGAARVPETALLGVPPLVDGALLHLDGPAAPNTPDGDLELHVVGGPDAGSIHLLAPGPQGPLLVRIGRSGEAEVRLDDPDVSRLHAELAVERDWITARDLGSTNGSTLDGKPIDQTPSVMLPGAMLRLGESTLTIALGQESLPTHPDGAGRVHVDRPPRQRVEVPQTRVELPPKPSSRGLPAARRRAAASYETERQIAEQRIATALSTEARFRREAAPDPAALLGAALRPTRRLWERRRDDDDLLELRLGTARLPSRVAVGAGEKTLRPRVPSVPVTLRLPEVGVLGLVGPRPELAGLARMVVAQVAALHSPQDVEIVLLCGDDDPAGWEWLRWLPHLRPGDGQDCRLLVGLDRAQIAARVAELTSHLFARQSTLRAAGSEQWTGRRTVLVLDPVATLCRPDAPDDGIARLLADGPAVGIYSVCLAERARELPSSTGAMVTLGGEVCTRLRVERPDLPTLDGAVADLVSVPWAERFARAVAPLREASADRERAALPEHARLLDLLGLDLLTPAKLASRWAARPSSGFAVLGSDGSGPLVVNLDERPGVGNVLVAGAPGSGVSELLAALSCGLAATNRPDALSLVFAGVRQDSPLLGCGDLPHTSWQQRGWEQPGDAEMLLRGLTELARRHTGGPRLVLVVDGLREWEIDLPGFTSQLCALASDPLGQGRVHLLLGLTVLDEDTIARLGALPLDAFATRVALRVSDVDVSSCLVDAPGAELVEDDDPGRGYALLPDGSTRPFRGARVSGRMPSTSTSRATVLKQHWHDLGNPLPRRADAAGGPTDLALLSGALRRAAEQVGIVRTAG